MHGFETSILKELSSSYPADISVKKVSTYDLSKAVSDLLNRKFKGLAEAELPPDIENFIDISPSQLAYFLRTLLKFIDGSAYLHIYYKYTDDCFIIEIHQSPPARLELSQKAKLCSAAREAGFIIEPGNDIITLSSELSTARSRVMAIYDKLSVDLELVFESVFFES